MSPYSEDNSYTIEFKEVREKRAFANWWFKLGQHLFQQDYQTLTKTKFKVGDSVRYHASIPPSLIRNRIYRVTQTYLSDDNIVYEIKRADETFFVNEQELSIITAEELEQIPEWYKEQT